MTDIARVPDHGFHLSFIVDEDLSGLTQVRMGLRRPESSSYLFRDLPAPDWNTLEAGDTLRVKVEPGDYTVAGDYQIELFGREQSGDTTLRSISSDPYLFSIGNTVAPDPWGT